MNPFPANLQSMRTRIGYTQEELGAATGIQRVMVVLYEAGKRTPGIEKVSKFAAVFGVPVDDLLLTEEEKTVIQADDAVDRICAALGRCRKPRNMSRQRLAGYSGLSLAQVQGIEQLKKQKNIPLTSALMLVLAMRCSVTELLAGDMDEPPFTPKKENARTYQPYSGENMVERINSLPTNARAALSMYLDYLVERCERTK